MTVNIPLKKVIDNSYDIIIDTISPIHFDNKVAIVTNPTVSQLHLEFLLTKITAKELHIITVPDGEEYKNQESIDIILESMFIHRFNRKSMLIAFGGGVIGDMTGYASSIYQRGVDFIQIPTTLLSQIDSSVGGKVGINHLRKNIIGSFYQPIKVLIDPNTLSTLNARQINNRMGEMIKYGLINDKQFFESIKKKDIKEKIKAMNKMIEDSYYNIRGLTNKFEYLKKEINEQKEETQVVVGGEYEDRNTEKSFLINVGKEYNYYMFINIKLLI